MPLPFSLARTLPRSPLRSDNRHRNRDGSLRSPIPSSLRSSLRLKAIQISGRVNRRGEAPACLHRQISLRNQRISVLFVAEPLFAHIQKIHGAHSCPLPRKHAQIAPSQFRTKTSCLLCVNATLATPNRRRTDFRLAIARFGLDNRCDLLYNILRRQK